jgi:hypothetical protein
MERSLTLIITAFCAVMLMGSGTALLIWRRIPKRRGDETTAVYAFWGAMGAILLATAGVLTVVYYARNLVQNAPLRAMQAADAAAVLGCTVGWVVMTSMATRRH